MIDPIKIDGLAEFRRNLKVISGELPKAIRVAGNKAAQLVVDDAVPKVPTRTGRAAKSIRASSTQTAAKVTGGGKRASYYPWLDFGGRVGRKRGVSRPFMKTGRYIWKSFDDRSDQVREKLSEALIDVARQSGVEVDS